MLGDGVYLRELAAEKPSARTIKKGGVRVQKIRQQFREFDWEAVLFAAFWLLFLVVYFVQMLVTENPGPARVVLCAVMLLVFAGIYILSFGVNTMIPAAPQWLRTLLWTLLLLAPIAVLASQNLMWLYASTPYFVAIWAFQTPRRLGIPVGIGIATLSYGSMLIERFEFVRSGGYWLMFGSVTVLLMSAIFRYVETHQKLQQKAQKAEFANSVARDVHDILGHTLTVINLKSELAENLFAADPARARAEIVQVRDLAKQALGEVRGAVTRLQIPSLREEVAAALAALETAGITAHTAVQRRAETAENSVLFAWVLREAVTNVVRHSGAANCWITVTATTLTVADDGAGGDVTFGNGVRGITARVREAGGVCRITTESGTTLRVTM